MEEVTIGKCRLIHGDAVEIMPTLQSESIDAIICDPPYAEIDRDYGRLSEPDWHSMINQVVAESRRLLTPRGSAVYILQSNSEKIGRMRPWIFEFVAKYAREWNLIQDVYWWNTTALPVAFCRRQWGLMRPSVKHCVWLGAEDCYRNQDEILNPLREETRRSALTATNELRYGPSGASKRDQTMYATAVERGGSTPFNLWAISASGKDHGSKFGHGAATPMKLVDQWVRYISAPSSTVLDMFNGSGTTGVACVRNGRGFIGIEREKKYFDISCERIAKEYERPEGDCFPDEGE